MAETITDVKKSLITQLKTRDANVILYRDQIDDYIFFTQQKRAMHTDIKKRGRTYTAVSAAGKEYEKDNPSVKNAFALQ